MESTYDDETRTANLSSGQIIYSVHRSVTCQGEVCPLHKPSDHSLRIFPLKFDPLMGHFFRDVYGTDVLDPDDYILRKYGKAIVRNSAQCLECGSRLVSEYRHDFKSCTCGNVFVDGGGAYIRHLVRNSDTYINDSNIVYLTDYK